MNKNEQPEWAKLLEDAVKTPGMIHECYSRFWNYSVGNQILALVQAHGRELQLGPVNTFKGWQALGRNVKKGEKAIAMIMPVTCKRKPKEGAEKRDDDRFTMFVMRNNWFLLSQTEGEDYSAPAIPEWDRDRALVELEIALSAYESLDGNSQGYARAREIAINPVAALPHKTMFHELAHVVLGHTTENEMHDGEMTPRSIREVEAESVALICCESLGLPGAEFSRGYIQSWLREQEIPEKSARRIFGAATKILKAGRGEEASC